MTDYKVADINLADFGRKEIALAEAEMPALMALRRKYADEQPLAGAKIIGCIHMTIQTAVLMETLIALSISATINPAAQLAMEKLEELRGREVHMTHIPTPGDEAGLRRLGVSLTSDPNFSTKDLFIS